VQALHQKQAAVLQGTSQRVEDDGPVDDAALDIAGHTPVADGWRYTGTGGGGSVGRRSGAAAVGQGVRARSDEAAQEDELLMMAGSHGGPWLESALLGSAAVYQARRDMAPHEASQLLDMI
jgi:hypothetical protein